MGSHDRAPRRLFWNRPKARLTVLSGTPAAGVARRAVRTATNEKTSMSVSIVELRRLNMGNVRRSSGGRFASHRRVNRYNPLRFESGKHSFVQSYAVPEPLPIEFKMRPVEPQPVAFETQPVAVEPDEFASQPTECEPALQHCNVTYIECERSLPGHAPLYSPDSPCVLESPPATPEHPSPDEFEPAWHMPDWFEDGSKDSPIEID